MAEVSFPWAPRGDVIAFETPELTRVEYRLAPFGARVVAAALDRLIIMAICILIAIGGLFAASGAGLVGDQTGIMFVLAGAMVVIFFLPALLLAFLEARSGGQTWGKRLMGLRTVSLTGHAPGVAAALVRNLARVIDDAPPMWVVPTLTASRQRLGDLLAGTCVVIERVRRDRVAPIKWPAESWRALENRQFELPPEAARRLVPDDLDLIEHVMRRVETEDSPRRRDALLRPIVARYIRRLDVPQLEPKALEVPRRFLGELGLMLKDRQEAR
jgi:uncharacterized RDD family membrane protein YckC